MMAVWIRFFWILFVGGVPEWPKGSDCKSDGSAFDGSNPSPSTIQEKPTHLSRLFLCLSKILASAIALNIIVFGFAAILAKDKNADKGIWQ